MARRARRTRNRKKHAAGFIFPPSVVSVLVIAGALSLGYLALCSRCEALGKRIKLLEDTRARVQKERVNKEYNWHAIRSWPNLEKILARHGLVMDWPDKERTVEVPQAVCRFEGGARELNVPGEGLRMAMND
ncbi:MAG: hypothetical protein JXB04_03770 [Kiritimatiellae bacterium]|nr:hypothetical protein [Kiritimatiellia bacterium]